jgi:hypothetical protein
MSERPARLPTHEESDSTNEQEEEEIEFGSESDSWSPKSLSSITEPRTGSLPPPPPFIGSPLPDRARYPQQPRVENPPSPPSPPLPVRSVPIVATMPPRTGGFKKMGSEDINWSGGGQLGANIRTEPESSSLSDPIRTFDL